MYAIFFTLAALACVQFTVGDDKCVIRGDLTNSLKCGDKVYTRNQELVNAMVACTSGKVGQPVTNAILACVHTKNQLLISDGSGLDNGRQHISQDFGEHAEKLLGPASECYFQFKNESPDSSKMMDCLNAAYEKVCGHKTCNWLNNKV